MKNKTIFSVIWAVMLTGLLVLTACPEPDAGDGKSKEKDKGQQDDSSYSYKFGDIAQEMGFEIPPGGISLDNLMQLVFNGMTYQEILDSGEIPTLYKDSALKNPFSGGDILDENTMIYCRENLFGDNGNGNGEKVGEIIGTITLTDIPSPPPKVEIRVDGNGNGWWTNYNRINISGPGTLSNIAWSIPIYENNGFYPSEGNFRLFITPADGNSYEIPVPDTRYIGSNYFDVGDLGTISLKTLNLSGTINVKYNGNNVPSVVIRAINNDTGEYIGSTELQSPGNGAPWSIRIPSFNSAVNIRFIVDGFNIIDYGGGYEAHQYLFYKDLETPIVAVNNSSVENIFLDVGNILVITLSGTINVTCNNQPVPNVEIQAYYDAPHGGEQWVGNVDLESPGPDAQWSMTLQEFDSTTLVKFRVIGRADWQEIFSKELSSPTVTVSSSSPSEITGINISIGNITTVTLSGTIKVTCNNQPVSNVRIYAFDHETNNHVGSILIESPCNDVPWSIILPESNTSEKFRFRVSGDYNGYRFDKEIPLLIVPVSNPSGISLNLNLNTITVSGTINVTCNNQPLTYVYINAYSGDPDDGEWVGNVYIESPGSNAPWSMTLPTFATSTQISFRVDGTSKTNGEYFSKTISSPRPTVYNTDVQGVNINIGNVTIITLSGTFNFTSNNNQPLSGIEIIILDNSNSNILHSPYYDPNENTEWSVVLPEISFPTQIKFRVLGYYNGDTIFYREISGTTLNGDNTNVSIPLNLGNITPVTMSGTINVNYNGQPVPHVRLEAQALAWNQPHYRSFFAYTELTSPEEDAQWSITFPSLNSSTEVLFSVTAYSEEGYYLANKNVVQTENIFQTDVSDITLNIGDMSE